MDPTSLPTDNLYKFLALGGMLGVGAVLYWKLKYLNERTQREEKLQFEHDKLQLAIEILKTDLDAQDAKDSIRELRERENAIGHNVLELKHLSKSLAAFKKTTEQRYYWFVAALSLASGMMMFGFVAWYLKYQLYADWATIDSAREQRAKADLAELELRRALAEDKPKRTPPK